MKETPLFNALACGFMLHVLQPQWGIMILLAIGVSEVIYFSKYPDRLP
jgi:hypothetical protein